MNKICKFLVFLAIFLLAVSCVKVLDPFSGGLGIRMNVNGKRCVSYSYISTTGAYANFTKPEDGKSGRYTFSKKMDMKIADADTCFFSLEATSASQMITGQAYDSKATLEVAGKKIPMTGNLTFVTLDDGLYVEAEFELSGSSAGEKYEVKHGFLRLKRYSGQ